MMTTRELITKLEMLDGSALVFVGGEPGELEDVVQIDTHTVVLLGTEPDDEDGDNG